MARVRSMSSNSRRVQDATTLTRLDGDIAAASGHGQETVATASGAAGRSQKLEENLTE